MAYPPPSPPEYEDSQEPSDPPEPPELSADAFSAQRAAPLDEANACNRAADGADDAPASPEPFQTWTPQRGPVVKIAAWTIIVVFGLCMVGMVVAVVVKVIGGS